MVGWLCFTSHRQPSHFETAPPFTLPCEGSEAQFLHRSHRESNPGPSRCSPLHCRCTTPAPMNNRMDEITRKNTTYHYCYRLIDYSIIELFQHQRSCSTRYKSGARIQYSTLAIDPRRSFKCMSP